MGMILDQVVFEPCAPSTERIVKQMEELTGLPLLLDDLRPVSPDQMYDVHAFVSFACFPDDQIELRGYRPGSVKAFNKKMGIDHLPVANFVEGASDRSGTQTVFIRGFASEPTLLIVAQLALEKLGGKPVSPLPEKARKKYDRPISVGDLKKRRRMVSLLALLGLALFVVLLPIYIPLMLISISWRLITLPQRFREFRKYYDRPSPDSSRGV